MIIFPRGTGPVDAFSLLKSSEGCSVAAEVAANGLNGGDTLAHCGDECYMADVRKGEFVDSSGTNLRRFFLSIECSEVSNGRKLSTSMT